MSTFEDFGSERKAVLHGREELGPPMLIPPFVSEKLAYEVANRLPTSCQQGLLDYLRYGVPPGHFLLAVLSNDLSEACRRADEPNQRALYDYIVVLDNFAPAMAWGSPEIVQAWIDRGLQLRRWADVGGRE